MTTRGFFAIGVEAAKTPDNVGTLMRSAQAFGAAQTFVVGARYPRDRLDTGKSWRHVPLIEHVDAAALIASIPLECALVAVECGEHVEPKALSSFRHPERAVYVLGAEDRGVSDEVLDRADHVIAIPSQRCLNVAVAGSIVMYDRMAKLAPPQGGDTIDWADEYGKLCASRGLLR